MPTINTISRSRMAAIYAPVAGTATATCQRRAPTGWTARADLTDIHPITGRVLARAVWWIIETKE